jgi:hypothetical protein
MLKIEAAEVPPNEEHVALLAESGKFGLIRRKDDLLAEGVAAVFGIAGGEAQLLALCFHGKRFTPAHAASWLIERGFTPIFFVSIPAERGGSTHPESGGSRLTC